MKLLFLSTCIIISILLTPAVLAQDQESPPPAASETPAVSASPEISPAQNGLPGPGLTPDSVFYFLDILVKKVTLFFTFDPKIKAEKAMNYAGEKLSEMKLMVERNRPAAEEKARQYYQEFLNLAIQKIGEAKSKGQDVSKLEDLLSFRTLNYQEILGKLLEKAPEAVYGGLKTVIEFTQTKFEEAVKAMAEAKKQELLRQAEDLKNRLQQEIKKFEEKAQNPATSTP